MNSRNGKARGVLSTAGPEINVAARQHDQRQDSGAVNQLPGIVAARAYPPSGRRGSVLLIVVTCPCCHGTHLHRAPTAALCVRRAGCGRGTYIVAPITLDNGQVAA